VTFSGAKFDDGESVATIELRNRVSYAETVLLQFNYNRFCDIASPKSSKECSLKCKLQLYPPRGWLASLRISSVVSIPSTMGFPSQNEFRIFKMCTSKFQGSERRRCMDKMMFADRRLARKSSMPPAAGIYYDQRKEMQYSDYRISDRQRSRTSTPMRFAGETKSLHAPLPPFTAGYGRPRPAPPPPPPHQGPGAYLHGRSLSSNATGSLLYHAIDSGGSGVESRYVEHIYESPTCVRKDFDGQGAAGADSLQYFEIESERRVGAGNVQESSSAVV